MAVAPRVHPPPCRARTIARSCTAEQRSNGNGLLGRAGTARRRPDRQQYLRTRRWGQVTIQADRLLVAGDGATNLTGIASSAEAGSTGAGGMVNIQAQTALARGGDVTVGRLFDLHNSAVTASVAGGTGSGGNIFINPPLMVLDNSRIEANPLRGAGGNITIQAGQLIRTPDSVIRASSELGLSGTISIAAPNTDVSSSLTVLPETFFDASSQLRVACAARGGRRTSSLTPSGRGGLPPDPGTPLVISPSGQPLEQQTATGSPTALTARPPQAVKPVMV